MGVVGDALNITEVEDSVSVFEREIEEGTDFVALPYPKALMQDF